MDLSTANGVRTLERRITTAGHQYCLEELSAGGSDRCLSNFRRVQMARLTSEQRAQLRTVRQAQEASVLAR